MTHAIECRTCHRQLAVGPELQGRRIRCPGCKEVMRVPLEESGQPCPHADISADVRPDRAEPLAAVPQRRADYDEEPDDDDDDDDESFQTPPRGSRRPDRKARNPLVFALRVGGAVALVALAAFAIALNVDWYALNPTPLGQQAVHAEAPPLPPPPKLEELPAEPAPTHLDAKARSRVMGATVYLKVTRAANVVQEGSGFFAAEPGLVITSAHVVGMGASGCSAPSKVEVVVHSGAADETTLQGQVLAADWVSDLAVVRVTEPVKNLPAPLAIGSSAAVSELQKVYVLGFPLGAGLGKNITVSESSVSALRKDDTGAVRQIQVNAQILPGNSGGPVVDTRGVVVGMAVAFLGGPSLSFAVPGEKVHDLLRGRVEDLHMGEPYADKQRVLLPVTLSCLDPLQRLRDVSLEVWAGNPGDARPSSFTKPAALAGDGPRQVLPLTYQNGLAAIDVVLPPLNKDQVLWVQPVLTDGGGTTRWTAATRYTPTTAPPLQRVAADIRLRFDKAPEWSIKIVHADDIETTIGSQKVVNKKRLEINLLELTRNDVKEGEFKLYLGPCKALYENNGVKGTPAPQVLSMLGGEAIRYTTNLEGSWQQRSTPDLKAAVANQLRLSFNQLVNDVANSYESTCLVFPNRLVQARETWPARLPLLTAGPFGGSVANLVVTCTFEGCRLVDGDNQAVITMAGVLEGGNPPRPLGGKVTGTFHIALAKGCVAGAHVKIEHLFGSGNIFTHRLTDLTLTRTPGNPLGIVPRGPAAVPKGKIVFETAAALDAMDRTDLRQKCFAKAFPVMLEAGQAYVIEMNRLGVGVFDPYLVLRDPTGAQVADDDDGGGEQNARILYTAKESGLHEIWATTCDPGQTGGFRLTVAERAAAKLPDANQDEKKPSASSK